MAPTAPSPLTWTLRLKHHRSTTLVYADPLQSFDSIKKELLSALHQTHRDGRFSDGTQIPSDPKVVIFGQLVDAHDVSQGWKRIDVDSDIIDDDTEDVVESKTTTKKKQKSRSAAFRQDSPMSAGLKDGIILAYKFRNGTEETQDLDEGAEDWDVVLASYEDAADVASPAKGK